MLKNRKAVLDIIMESSKPLKIEDIHEKLNDKINQSTVYRSVDWLLKEGFILKTYILDAIHYYPKKEPHKHFKVCLKCKDIQEMPCTLKVEDFTVIRDEVVVYGYCKECK